MDALLEKFLYTLLSFRRSTEWFPLSIHSSFLGVH
jgi:hypothetical protein